MKPFHFSAQAFQELIIWAETEEEAAELIDDAIDTSNWQMDGADWMGEVNADEVKTFVRHGASELKP